MGDHIHEEKLDQSFMVTQGEQPHLALRHPPQHSLTPVVVVALLGCRLLCKQRILPGLKVLHLTLAEWGLTRYIPPVHLTSIALKKIRKDGEEAILIVPHWQTDKWQGILEPPVAHENHPDLLV